MQQPLTSAEALPDANRRRRPGPRGRHAADDAQRVVALKGIGCFESRSTRPTVGPAPVAIFTLASEDPPPAEDDVPPATDESGDATELEQPADAEPTLGFEASSDSAEAEAATAKPVPKTRAKCPTKAKGGGTRSKTTAKKAAGANPGQRRGTRPFPANAFEDALVLPEAIQRFGSGQRIRRLTLFNELGRAPDSSLSRDLIYASSRYALTKGNHQSEWLELTAEGTRRPIPRLRHVSARGHASCSPSRGSCRSRNLRPVCEQQAPGGGGDARPPDRRHQPARRPSVRGSRNVHRQREVVGVLKPVSGVERLLPLDHALDELPGRAETVVSVDNGTAARRSATGQPAIQGADRQHTCFYVTPSGTRTARSDVTPTSSSPASSSRPSTRWNATDGWSVPTTSSTRSHHRPGHRAPGDARCRIAPDDSGRPAYATSRHRACPSSVPSGVGERRLREPTAKAAAARGPQP